MNTSSILLRLFNDLKTWGARQCNQMYFHNDACIIKVYLVSLEFLPDKISSKKIWFITTLDNTKKNCLEELYLLFTTCNHRLGSGLNLITYML